MCPSFVRKLTQFKINFKEVIFGQNLNNEEFDDFNFEDVDDFNY